jgi:hypothetical protein
MSIEQFESKVSAALGRKVKAEKRTAKNGKTERWEIRANGYLFVPYKNSVAYCHHGNWVIPA